VLKEVLPAFTARLGANHHQTLVSKANLAGVYQDQGKHALAEPLLKDVLAAFTAQLGADHPNTLAVKNILAVLYQDQGKYDQAEPLLLEVLAARQKRLGPDHLNVAATLAVLGVNYLGQHRYVEAEPRLRAALAICAQKKPDKWPHFHTQSLLGASLLGLMQGDSGRPELVSYVVSIGCGENH
jgi:tetratricopeptide (TPR) repeat protein